MARGRRSVGAVVALAVAVGLASSPRVSVSAQAPASSGDAALASYLEALASQRLLAAETGSIEALRDAVRAGEALFFDGRHDEAALVLYEVVESPRFADFAGLDEYRSAELTLASALAELGALRTASRYLLRVLASGPDDPLFGPAFRRFVDVGLEGANLPGAIAALEGLGMAALPEDAENELRYLRARAAYDAGELPVADGHLARIGRRSRFYTNGLYLRGVIATRGGRLEEAEGQFCRIAETPDRERFSFFIDDRYFEVKDLAFLALGRLAHEGRRPDDAFYYYFQVPNDSERVAEALFEAAYAMYEGNDMDTAVDLLDQLEARFPRSAFAHEASLLRGYVHLSRCEFDRAERHFIAFLRRFEPVIVEIDRVLASPALQATLHDSLLSAEERAEAAARTAVSGGSAAGSLALTSSARAANDAPEPTAIELLLGLLRVDPAFYRLHSDIRVLDAEAARAGRLSIDLAALAARLRGEDAPASAAEVERYETEAAALRRDLERARGLLAGLHGQLASLRQAEVPSAEIAPLEAELTRHAARLRALERQLRRAQAQGADAEVERPAASGDVEALLRRDALRARRLPRRVAAVRGRLSEHANQAGVASLRQLRAQLAGHVRRARIGRIDAVMGSKRRIEIQIESLAAGRFPPELMDPLRVQGLLREDEEYWPFEGEHWADEFEESSVAGEGARR